jgi:hypothetical protein
VAGFVDALQCRNIHKKSVATEWNANDWALTTLAVAGPRHMRHKHTATGLDRLPKPSDPARGMYWVTRHPVTWAIGLWGIVHMLANGD